jgi:hypothetical protein
MLPPRTPAAELFGRPGALLERDGANTTEDDTRARRLLALTTEADLLREAARFESGVVRARTEWDISRVESEIAEIGATFRAGDRS